MDKKDLDELNNYGESLIADAINAKQSDAVEIPNNVKNTDEFVDWMTKRE